MGAIEDQAIGVPVPLLAECGTLEAAVVAQLFEQRSGLLGYGTGEFGVGHRS